MTFEKTLEAVKEAYPNLDYETLKSITKMVYRFGYEFGDYNGWEECLADDGNCSHVKVDGEGNTIAYNDGNICLKINRKDYKTWHVGYCNDTTYIITSMDIFYRDKRQPFNFNFKRGTEVFTNYEYQYDSNHNITEVVITAKDGIKRYTLQLNKSTYMAGDGSTVQRAVLYYYDFEYKKFIEFCVGFIRTDDAMPLVKPKKRRSPDWYHLTDISEIIDDGLEDTMTLDKIREVWHQENIDDGLIRG